jgi:hypothetical protein
MLLLILRLDPTCLIKTNALQTTLKEISSLGSLRLSEKATLIKS